MSKEPPRARAAHPKAVRDQWQKRGLPDDLTGKTVMDVGCWAGGYCVVAREKGASRAIGVDICRSPKLLDIEFEQMDFMSDTAFQLPQVDVVMLLGVLYHTHDPVGMLMRARRLALEEVWIETAICNPGVQFPQFKTFDDHTNWFRPNPAAVRWMCSKVGLEPVDDGHEWADGRYVLRATVGEIPAHRPRGIDWMDL